MESKNSKLGKIRFWAIGLAVAAAAAGFVYWLAAPFWQAPAAAVPSNVANGQAAVPFPQPQITEPTAPPPTVSTEPNGGQDRRYAPPTGQPGDVR